MRKLFLSICALASLPAFAQIHSRTNQEESWKKIYRAADTKINDLVHTRLDVKFDYAKAYLYGRAWITLQPHFYPTDSLRLDAKGMNINTVAMVSNGKNTPLQFDYHDSVNLYINLGRTYQADEKYTIYIDYVAKPNELKVQGSAAITDAKGLYFINPQGKDKDKPTQIWTQGETEATSVWCPTIDRPNQKTTEEISMTVPDRYVTLSNGLLVSQKKNTDGTRTDNWKMDLPHAPYLFFMGVGDYAIVKDHYKNKEVSYYVEKPYEKVARRIFGNTPEMIAFYSRITGIDFPWPKYAQIVGRDYVSGAMENTTATLHQENAQQNARELTDGNNWETTVAHELFHQWFGDLATCESWSNLTMNESFANYSETLWEEYKYGKDAGAEQNYTDMLDYFRSRGDNKDLVRFYYADKEDMFDAVTYNKGGRILNMLRHYVGDSAFFKSLHTYLAANKFKATEAQQLRLAFEEVTGRDLNWYWNQWYDGSGHPRLDISYGYDAEKRMAKVFIRQTQDGDKIFTLPIDIDVYVGNKKERYSVWMKDKADTFAFQVSSKPDLVNVDGDKILLAQKQEHKTLAEYAHQYKYAGNYVDRREAIEYAADHHQEDGAVQLLNTALDDSYKGIRSLALKSLVNTDIATSTLAKVEEIAKKDPHRPNRALAIGLLGDLQNKQYQPLFEQSLHDSSYTVAAAALAALADLDETKAIAAMPSLKEDARGDLKATLDQLDVLTKTDADFDTIYNKFNTAPRFEKLAQSFTLITYLSKVQNPQHFKTGVTAVTDYSNRLRSIAPRYSAAVNKELQKLKKKKEALKDSVADKTAIAEELSILDEKLRK